MERSLRGLSAVHMEKNLGSWSDAGDRAVRHARFDGPQNQHLPMRNTEVVERLTTQSPHVARMKTEQAKRRARPIARPGCVSRSAEQETPVSASGDLHNKNFRR